MVKHYWEIQEQKALKILQYDIRHAEKCGQGQVVQKKKRHYEELKHNIELNNDKRLKQKKQDEIDFA